MNQLFEFLVNNPQTSMSVYKHPYTGATQFTFSDVVAYENIVLNWLYDKFVICYKNEIFDIKIKSSLKHFLHTTLCFGQAVFEKLMWDVAQIKKIEHRYGMVKIIRDDFVDGKIEILVWRPTKIKRRYGMVKIIENYFLNKENEILIYRPTVGEIILKINEINEEKKEPNKKCCVCLEPKYISDVSIFKCAHTELCWGCYLKIGNNLCPLCRSSIPL